MSLRKMREMFVVLEQQRVSRDAVEGLGPPSIDRFNRIMAERVIAEDIETKKVGKAPDPK